MQGGYPKSHLLRITCFVSKIYSDLDMITWRSADKRIVLPLVHLKAEKEGLM